jgi:hypothetical protein
MSSPWTRSGRELGGRLQIIARIAAECRAANAAEEKRSRPRNSRQFTIGQLVILITLWALGLAAWRLTW